MIEKTLHFCKTFLICSILKSYLVRYWGRCVTEFPLNIDCIPFNLLDNDEDFI